MGIFARRFASSNALKHSLASYQVNLNASRSLIQHGRISPSHQVTACPLPAAILRRTGSLRTKPCSASSASTAWACSESCIAGASSPKKLLAAVIHVATASNWIRVGLNHRGLVYMLFLTILEFHFFNPWDKNRSLVQFFGNQLTRSHGLLTFTLSRCQLHVLSRNPSPKTLCKAAGRVTRLSRRSCWCCSCTWTMEISKSHIVPKTAVGKVSLPAIVN